MHPIQRDIEISLFWPIVRGFSTVCCLLSRRFSHFLELCNPTPTLHSQMLSCADSCIAHLVLYDLPRDPGRTWPLLRSSVWHASYQVCSLRLGNWPKTSRILKLQVVFWCWMMRDFVAESKGILAKSLFWRVTDTKTAISMKEALNLWERSREVSGILGKVNGWSLVQIGVARCPAACKAVELSR